MNLIKIRSRKHKGSIFIRLRNVHGGFICKIYPANNANYIADTIIRSLSDIEYEREQDEHSPNKESRNY